MFWFRETHDVYLPTPPFSFRDSLIFDIQKFVDIRELKEKEGP